MCVREKLFLVQSKHQIVLPQNSIINLPAAHSVCSIRSESYLKLSLMAFDKISEERWQMMP